MNIGENGEKNIMKNCMSYRADLFIVRTLYSHGRIETSVGGENKLRRSGFQMAWKGETTDRRK